MILACQSNRFLIPIKVRPDVSASMAAGLANELRLDVGYPRSLLIVLGRSATSVHWRPEIGRQSRKLGPALRTLLMLGASLELKTRVSVFFWPIRFKAFRCWMLKRRRQRRRYLNPDLPAASAPIPHGWGRLAEIHHDPRRRNHRPSPHHDRRPAAP
jgi:hypothetical protein